MFGSFHLSSIKVFSYCQQCENTIWSVVYLFGKAKLRPVPALAPQHWLFYIMLIKIGADEI
jgi:hypothetical protein